MGEHHLFERDGSNRRTHHHGYAVKLPGWNYPVICDLQSKTVYMDNFGGSWGNIAEFNKLKQAYATEAAIAVARRQGFRVQEQKQPNGAIKLVLAK